MVRVLHSYSRAHRVLWTHGLWRYMLIPLVIAPFVLALLGSAMYFGVWTRLFSWAETHWLSGHSIPAVVQILLFCGLALLLAGPCYVALRGILMVCYAPFMDGLISRTLRIENGEGLEGDMGFLRVLTRSVLMVIFTTGASLIVAAVGLVLGFAPLIGPVLSFLFAFPLQMFLCGVSSVDPCLERYNRSAGYTMRLLWRHKTKMALFGAISTGGMFIPLLGWVMAPTYSLVAGVILGMELEQENATPPPPPPK
jgi:CysZ protein